MRFVISGVYGTDEPDPASDACRRTQLWLRDTQVDDMLEYVRSRPRISERSKLALVADIERFAAAGTGKGLYKGGR